MKTFPLILIGATVVVGSSAMVLSKMQDNNRLARQVAELQAKEEAQGAQLHTAQLEAEKLRSTTEVFQNESEELRKRLASSQLAVAGAPKDAAAGNAKAGAKEEAQSEGGNFMKGMAKMFNDPQMKDAMRAQQGMGIRMMYGDLARELGLSAEEGKQVIEMLIDRQMAMAAKSMAAMGGAGNDPKSMEEAGKLVNASKAEYDLQIQGVLGEERMAKLAKYESTLNDRMQLQQIQTSLTSNGLPLNEGQSKNLLSIMTEERAKVPQGVFSPGNTDVGAQVKAMQSSDAVEQMLKSNEEINKRVVTRARDVLSPDQMNAFETAQKQQAAMMQMGVKMMQNMNPKK